MKLSRIIIAATAVGIATAASAQQAPRTAYFMDGYTFRHELNAAFAGERNYVSIPMLANMDFSIASNVGVSTFIYKMPAGSPYKLTTFMSPTVDAGKFLDKLADNNHLTFNADVTLLSAGFKAFKGFNTITVGFHTDMGMNLPKDLFRFMKVGQSGPDTRYSIKDLKLNATAYGEVALGHTHDITDKLTIGAKLKFLLGFANMTANISRMDVRLSNETWRVSAKGKVEMAAGPGLKVPTYEEAGVDYDLPADADLISFDDIKYDSFGLAGFGMGLDLGATYQLLPDLQLSLAVNDLGFINWNNAHIGETNDAEWSFDGFKDVTIKDTQANYENNKLEQQVDDLKDQFEDCVEFHRTAGNSYTKALNATIHVGAEYKMPFYKKLTGAFLFSQHIAGCQSWTEGRFYANVKPTKWFDATINYGASTFGNSFGWMLNFHPKGFNFFIGSDHQFFNLTPQMLPVGNANFSINLGMAVTFGS